MKTWLDIEAAASSRIKHGPEPGDVDPEKMFQALPSLAAVEAPHERQHERAFVQLHDGSGLKAFLQFISRQVWIIIATFTLACIASFALIAALDNHYTASATLIMDQRNNRAADSLTPSLSTVDSEVEVLKSDHIALMVIERLRLDENPEFTPKSGLFSKLISKVSEINSLLFPQAKPLESATSTDPPTSADKGPVSAATPLSHPDTANEPEPSNSAAGTLRTLKKKVAVRRNGLTDVVTVEATSLDPGNAALIANAFASTYLEEQVRAKLDSIAHAEASLMKRLNDINQELGSSGWRLGLQEAYQASAAQLKDVLQQRNLVSPDARIVSSAREPDRPSYPRRGLFLLLGGIASLGLAFGVAYARDTHSYKIHSEEEVELVTGLHNLGTIPRVRSAQAKAGQKVSDYIITQPDSSYSESVRRLRFMVQSAIDKTKTNRSSPILVTSAKRGEGKSTLAVALARSAAASGLKAILVDCDIRNPTIHKMLNLQNETGLADLLSSPSLLNNLMQTDTMSGCKVLTAGANGELSPERLMRPEILGRIIQMLCIHFDFVVIDAPPVYLYADPLMLTNSESTVLFAIKAGPQDPHEIRSCIRQICRTSDARIFTVLNNA